MSSSPVLRAVEETTSDRELESQDEDAQDTQLVRVPALLPVPASLAKPSDVLCTTCTALDLTQSRFVVLPGDSDGEDDIMQLGLVKDIKERSMVCPFCRLVLRAVSNGDSDVPEVQDGENVKIILGWDARGPKPYPEQLQHDSIPQIRVLSPYVRTQSGKSVDVMKLNMFPEITVLANDAPPPSRSELTRLMKDKIDFSMVRNWLTMCRVGHGDFCNQSRVLDHEISDPVAEIPSFRLIDVIESRIVPAPHACKYVALSYVWGNVNPASILRLLKANLEELEIPGSLLQKENHEKIPKTIRDALEVVRELDFRYLWTDSLCIIQDDEDAQGSKFDAISKMDLVYGAAYLTIVAATGRDANVGLPGLYPGTRGMPQAVEEIAPGFRLAFKARSEDHIRNSVYHTRGWTFQEQIFARRKLTFLGGQVEYSCKAGSGWREDTVFEDRHLKDLKEHGAIGSSDRNPNEIVELLMMISTYSGLSLKFHTDIYNAFAGMMRYFKTELRLNLCHGIPDRYFDWFFLWEPQAPPTRCADAPSWSWSGWNGGCRVDIWNYYGVDLERVRAALRKRTWIIWYQRTAHDSVECKRLWTPKADPESSESYQGTRNFYGGPVQDRFALDCTMTAPTPRILTGAPNYIRDAYFPSPGSGFLQFWTVSTEFKLAEATSQYEGYMPVNGYTRLGIFGEDGREAGIIFVDPAWCKDNVPNVHEVILVCEGRVEGAAGGGSPDEEPGWRYMVMLVEWRENRQWAERVAVGWLEKQCLDQALNDGPVWKEIVLG